MVKRVSIDDVVRQPGQGLYTRSNAESQSEQASHRESQTRGLGEESQDEVQAGAPAETEEIPEDRLSRRERRLLRMQEEDERLAAENVAQQRGVAAAPATPSRAPAPRAVARPTESTEPQSEAQPSPSGRLPRGPALGPRGQAIFERLFGSARTHRPESRRTEAPVLVVASGKGGTGKSFLSTSLSVVLHQQGHKVTLVDGDFGLACDHLLLGVRPKLHMRHLLTGDAALDEVLATSPAGPELLPGAAGVRQMAALPEHEMERFGDVLGQLAAARDLVLFDAGAGLTPQNCAFLCAADHVVLVTQPEIAALTDAYALVKTMAQVRNAPQVSIVVNRTTEPGQGQATYERLQSVASKHAGLSLGFLGSIGDDPLVTQRRLGQLPLVSTDPDGKTAQSIRAIAAKLEERVGPFEVRERASGESFARRLSDHRRLL
ncbi:MAG: P-loop NTPase [Planctomycetota bacterium]